MRTSRSPTRSNKSPLFVIFVSPTPVIANRSFEASAPGATRKSFRAFVVSVDDHINALGYIQRLHALEVRHIGSPFPRIVTNEIVRMPSETCLTRPRKFRAVQPHAHDRVRAGRIASWKEAQFVRKFSSEAERDLCLCQ
jgi:hypothetical protein